MAVWPDTSQITTEEQFVAFVAQLARIAAVEAEGWPNPATERYLEAMSAWAVDSAGFYAHRGVDPAAVSPWRFVADMLIAGTTYE